VKVAVGDGGEGTFEVLMNVFMILFMFMNEYDFFFFNYS
jgi:hypothetical protein